MPITYDPDTNTITIVGTKDGQPYCFEDIYLADVNNGWNKFTKLSEGVYKTTAKLCYGDGSTETWFEEKGTVLVVETQASYSGEYIIDFKANCNATFGEKVITDGEENYQKGCTFVLYQSAYSAWFNIEENSDVKFYACSFILRDDSYRFDFRGYVKEAKGCLFHNVVRDLRYTEFHKNIITGRYGYLENIVNCNVRDVFIKTTQDRMVWLGNSANQVFANISGSSSDVFACVNRLRSSNIAKFINCKPHNWKVNWYLAEGDVSGELQRIYAVRFRVTDINGNPLSNRTVKVYDKNGNLIVETTTDSNGLTDEVEILYAKLVNPYSDGKWHTFDENDWEYFNPFTIEVYYGNELEYRGVITDLDVESTFIQITVKPSSYTLDDIADKIEYVRKLFGNRWKIENNELKIYDDDNQTVIRRFKLYDKEGKPTETNVYDRVPV